MTTDVDKELHWLATLVCIPNWHEAAQAATGRTRGFELNLLRDGSLRDMSPEYLSRIAEVVGKEDAVTGLAWRLLALRPSDPASLIQAAVGDAVAILSSNEGDTTEALARLRVWDVAALGKFTGDDFFKLAAKYWRSELQYIVARLDEQNRCVSGAPACVELLGCDRWDEAFAWLSKETARQAKRLGIEPPPSHKDRKKQAALIRGHVEVLFAQGRNYTGDLALAWQMMLCDPRQPESFNAVLPQLTWLLNQRAIITNKAEQELLRARLQLWWDAAAGKWDGSDSSIFLIAAKVADKDKIYARHAECDGAKPEPGMESGDEPPPAGPTVVVMRGDRAEERGLPQTWKDLRDVALPLVVCDDAMWVREKLQEEHPHAFREIAMLTQDLRDDEPVRMRPILLLSQPGTGKTRLIRRLAEIIGPQMYVSRFDAAGTHDSMYSGTPKGWSTAQASVPARAIMASKTANPIVAVDEICKASESTYNGNLWSAMTPHLERETAKNYREAGIDAELDLSHVIHLATANSVERLPSQLRERYRVIRIPSPTLSHLPKLAALVMRDLAAEDDARRHDAPLAKDELEIIGRAWAREQFSMRKLQRLVLATLEARDTCAMRH